MRKAALTTELECANCGTPFEVELDYDKPEPDVGYSGGFSLAHAPEACADPDCGEPFYKNDILNRASDQLIKEDRDRRSDDDRYDLVNNR